MANSGDNSSKIKFIWNTDNRNTVIHQRSPTVVDHHDRPQNVGFESNQKSGVPEGSGKSRRGNSSMQQTHHPIRPVAKDCLFYVHTGSCSFGSACRFNHPAPIDQEINNGRDSGNSFQNSTRIPCKFYVAGFCKYGASCKFNHAIPPTELMQLQQYNCLGLPFRLGEPICSFYMRTGLCGFGAACKFHHPEPIFIKGPKKRNPYFGGEAMEYENGSTGINTNGAYIIQFPDSPQPYVATPMADYSSFQFLPDYGWNGYQVPELTQEMQLSSGFQTANFSSVAPATDAKTVVDLHPTNRPLVLAKTPVDLPQTSKPLVLNKVGLPVRPGRKVCRHYEKSGECKFGVDCIFDHPQKKGNVEKASTSKFGDETLETQE